MRLADQDKDGVAAEIIYPTVGMLICNHPDFDYKKACFDAYNRWLQAYCSHEPDRLVGMGQTAMRTVKEGIDDLERIKAMGFKRRDDAGQSRREGLRRPGLRSVLGGRRRARAAAVVPHPDVERRQHAGQAARTQDQRLPRDHPRLPGHHGHAGLLRRVRAASQAARRLRRGRCRLGAAFHVSHGPRLQAPPLLDEGQGAGAPAVGIFPRAHLAHLPGRLDGLPVRRPARSATS